MIANLLYPFTYVILNLKLKIGVVTFLYGNEIPEVACVSV